MAEVKSWSDVSNETARNNKGGIRNLKLESGQEYQVRFIGPPVKFHKYFVAGKSAICSDPETCSVRKKYNIEPGVRYAVNVLNRKDGQLYLVEVPPSVLKPVSAWGKRRQTDPGGVNACDFSISVTGQKKMTRYEVVPLDITPLTAEEQEYCKQNVYDLNKLFKATPDNEIEAKLFGGGGKPDAATAQVAPATEAKAAPAQAAKSVELPF
jgi:hypothetical protein